MIHGMCNLVILLHLYLTLIENQEIFKGITSPTFSLFWVKLFLVNFSRIWNREIWGDIILVALCIFMQLFQDLICSYTCKNFMHHYAVITHLGTGFIRTYYEILWIFIHLILFLWFYAHSTSNSCVVLMIPLISARLWLFHRGFD